MRILGIQQHATWGGGTTGSNNKGTFTTKYTKINHTLIHKSTKPINHYPTGVLFIRGVFKNMGNFVLKGDKSNYESNKHIKDNEEKGKKQYLGSL